jgi:hypothetical protein
MTMRVTIANHDAARTAEVTVQEFKKDEPGPEVIDRERISPGEVRSFYLHAGRRLLVDEVPEP